MPVKVARIVEHTRTVELPLPGEGEPLIITYCPARRNRKLRNEFTAVTRKAEQQIAAGEDPGFGEGDAAAFIVSKLATAWNVEDEKGNPVPITMDFLADTFGYQVCGQIHRAIQDDMDSVGNSSGGSE